MIKNNSISLIIPCKDEAQALKTVMEKMPKEIDEVIVVDNNSSDETKAVAKKYGAIVLSEVRKDKNGIGYGYAIRKGFAQARGKIVVCMDGDGSYPIEEVKKIVKVLLKKDLDFISCNRLPFRNVKKMSRVRALGVKILNLTTWFLFGYKIKDSLSGMWVIKRYALDNMHLEEGGWNLSLEIKLKAIVNPKIKFSEYHIPYQDRILNLSKQNLFRTGFEHTIYLIRFKENLIVEMLKRIAVAKNFDFN